MVGVQSPFGHTNAANTAPLPWGDRLFMTWDAGRPVEVDPVTFDYLGEVGHRSEWKGFEVSPQPLLPMVMSSAHPVIDPDRNTMWTVNTHWGQLHVVRWDGDGALRSWPVADGNHPAVGAHHHPDPRLVGDRRLRLQGRAAGLDRRGTHRTGQRRCPGLPGAQGRVGCDTAGQEVPCSVFRIAPEVNHYYAEYDDADGIRLLFEHTESAELAMTQRADDLDAFGRPSDPRWQGSTASRWRRTGCPPW